MTNNKVKVLERIAKDVGIDKDQINLLARIQGLKDGTGIEDYDPHLKLNQTSAPKERFSNLSIDVYLTEEASELGRFKGIVNTCFKSDQLEEIKKEYSLPQKDLFDDKYSIQMKTGDSNRMYNITNITYHGSKKKD